MTETCAQPKVSCVMLVCGREEMVARASRSYELQTYANTELIQHRNAGDRSIGMLRNEANALTTGEIICHFDSDDVSHPNRIAEQVALLQSSGADCVGYQEMLFWCTKIESGRVPDERTPYFDKPWSRETSEAWVFRNTRPGYALGTSLCYWRKTWERRQFKDLPQPGKNPGEDSEFIAGLKVESVTSLQHAIDCGNSRFFHEPRMIASIHGGNTTAYDPLVSVSWRRAPEWDLYCRERMAL
jgi:glycosyltransferase involved in cell wall biosynthesis